MRLYVNYHALAKSAGLTNEQANKYYEYAWRKHTRIDREEEDYGRDSYRQRTYDAENNWLYNMRYREGLMSKESDTLADIAEAQRYVNRILKTKTWTKLNGKPDTGIELFLLKGNANSGLAYVHQGRIGLGKKYGLRKTVVLHELAHMVGPGQHLHGVKFRQFHVALVRRFIGRAQGDALFKSYRDAGLKMIINHNVKTPLAWLKVSMPVSERGQRKLKAAKR